MQEVHIGVVSDDELLNLLDLALSSDTANTVRRARELMLGPDASSFSDSLLAAADIGMQKLRHALK
ncbi:hypothetical protein MUK42_27196, partial [Musa troglodytarum]